MESSRLLGAVMETGSLDNGGFLQRIPLLFVSGITWALLLLFACVACFAGAIAGALAGKASDSGGARGAGLGAIVGAVISLEIFEASRALLCLDQSAARSSSAVADFIEEVLRGRFMEEHFTPAMGTSSRWQGNFADINYDEIHDANERVASRGLSRYLLKRLPCHEISEETWTAQSICCAICLQDLEVGEIARSLPVSSHFSLEMCGPVAHQTRYLPCMQARCPEETYKSSRNGVQSEPS